MPSKVRKKQTSPTQMYKHFAVVTVCLTAVVGIMADGEAQQAVIKHQEEKAEEERIANYDAFSDGNRRLITEEDSDGGGGSFGSDASVGAGVGGGFSSSTTASVDVTGPDYSVLDNRPIWKRVGLTQEIWNSLSDEQKAAVAKARDPLYGRSAAQQRADLRRMSEASRLRAGSNDSSPGLDGPG